MKKNSDETAPHAADVVQEQRFPPVGRRGFLKGAAAIGAAGLGSSLIEARSATAAPAGGHLKVGVGGGATTDTLDIGTTGGAQNQTMIESIRSKLVDQETNGDIVPDLATEWGSGNGGRRWTFKLRKGAEFHNGKTVTPQDVIDSINVHRGQDSKAAGASLMKAVSELKSDGNDIVFDLSEPAADFPYYLAQTIFSICPSKDGVLDQSGIGSGAFVLEKFTPGVVGMAKRNPNYFKAERIRIESFELLSVNDSTALTNSLLAGELHVIQPVDPKTSEVLAKTAGIKVLSVPGGSTITMPMHADKEPFSNNDFRLALKYAVNRAELRDKVFYGHASLANDHPVPTFDKFFNADIPQRDYDPDKAKYHLAKSGFAGTKIQLHAADAAFSGALDAALVFADSAKKAGIEVEPVREPNDGYWSNVWGKVPFSFCYWDARPTPDLILSLAYICGAAWGDTNWCNERFTKLVAEARAELDQQRRKELYAEIQLILHDEGSTIVPLYQNMVHGVAESVDTGGPVGGAKPLDNFQIFKKWAVAS